MLVQQDRAMKACNGDAHERSTATAHVPMLDVLRACAALMVFAYHCYTEFMPGSTSLLVPTLSQGNFGVHLFFALSGYLIYAALDRSFSGPVNNLSTARNAAIFWTKRVFRIYPLYLISLAAVLVLNQNVRQYLSLGDLVSHLFGVHSFFRHYHGSLNGVLWSLAIEIQFYITAPFIFLAVRRVATRNSSPLA
jgi:peptidoglycan/LPS O-acetylase OafA/YrhL